jgi:hypothetical protein
MSALTGASALAGVTVMRHGPTRTEHMTQAGELVWLGAAKGDQEWAGQGRLAKNELYTIDFTVMKVLIGDDEPAAETRAWEIFSAVEAAVRADPSLAQAVRTAEVTGFDQTSEPVPEGFVVRIAAQLACEARI